MSRYLPIIGVLLLFFVSCRQASDSERSMESDDFFSDSDMIRERNLQESVEIEMVRDISEDRAKAREELLGILGSEPHLPEFMTGSYYHIDHIIEGEKPMDIIDEGRWYLFNENFTYQKGNIDDAFLKGRYAYKPTENKILLFPDDYNAFPEEWKILYADEIIVFVGTSKFGNNNVQKRMVRVKKRPGSID
jgi:hypothetical protein